jgi:SAM-dependent methyltransferase
MFKERGRAASDFYAGRPDYFYLTPASLALLRGLQPLNETYCRGRVLDAGAGRGVYRELLRRRSNDYVGFDIAASAATSIVGDAQRLPFADATFDTVFCSQVLEHVPEPWLALAEFRRVLKDDGHLILTVPHISWLHNEPHDYYRYTRHGLAHLLAKAGLITSDVAPAGGLLSLLGHVASTIWVNLFFGIPVIHPMIRSLNRVWVTSVAWLDGATEKNKLFALNYVCSATKDQRRPYEQINGGDGGSFGR